MHQEVLESDTYPLFVFHAQRITGELAREGKSQVELHGQLDVHGGTHPIAVPTTVEIDGNHLKASATFPVPYVEWGMKRPGFLFLKVAPVVTVSVDAKGSLQEAIAAESMATGRTGGR
jgi:polyisoprenoid-binding protein YceI